MHSWKTGQNRALNGVHSWQTGCQCTDQTRLLCEQACSRQRAERHAQVVPLIPQTCSSSPCAACSWRRLHFLFLRSHQPSTCLSLMRLLSLLALLYFRGQVASQVRSGSLRLQHVRRSQLACWSRLADTTVRSAVPSWVHSIPRRVQTLLRATASSRQCPLGAVR